MVTIQQLDEIRLKFEELSGLRGVQHETKKTVDGLVLVLRVSHVPKRLYGFLNAAIASVVPNGSASGAVATLSKLPKSNLLDGPEAKLLVRTLSETQNVSRHSFPEDFFERYTYSVGGAEEPIVANANHIVFGRRGAGKSMLLLYALNKVAQKDSVCVWVDVQLFNGRDDERVCADIVSQILLELSAVTGDSIELKNIVDELDNENINLKKIRTLLPRIKRYMSGLSQNKPVYIFLDDFHVLDQSLQPIVLDVIYSFSRGSNVYIKMSAIETLTNTYDAINKVGLEISQDVQALRLDNNLTTPDKTFEHLQKILDAHANYACLPSVRRLCSSTDVLPRLTWVSAGVPRDAMNLFAQAIRKAVAEDKKQVTVSNVNMASSETLTAKMRDLELDASDQATALKDELERIKKFCIYENKNNAFLVEILPGNISFANINELVQMRLLHVISEGITPGDAGKKFKALILDYGLYTGIRAAQSVELFNQKTDKASYRELRTLPTYKIK
ncbi:hypothetical protein G6L68_09415 [Agrobacterium fabrum]|uniref:hypothetical protein n=1 Tax=Agrobacterium fabrum TaxID=1176649 RepID=UPI0013CE63F0|nr:hypothetical protein [Agrobacterium fabrum]NTE60861.1 hypothetical protein [Agrobacterium fabrum]